AGQERHLELLARWQEGKAAQLVSGSRPPNEDVFPAAADNVVSVRAEGQIDDRPVMGLEAGDGPGREWTAVLIGPPRRLLRLVGWQDHLLARLRGLTRKGLESERPGSRGDENHA